MIPLSNEECGAHTGTESCPETWSPASQATGRETPCRFCWLSTHSVCCHQTTRYFFSLFFLHFARSDSFDCNHEHDNGYLGKLAQAAEPTKRAPKLARTENQSKSLPRVTNIETMQLISDWMTCGSSISLTREVIRVSPAYWKDI